MLLFKYIFTFVCWALAINGENIKTCPRFCKCDSYLLLNRAKCSSKHLISAEVDVPYQVQILDLSYNDITIVEKNCFKNFSHLKYLNLSNNALHTLELEAFSKLLHLTELDLSNNRLEYLDERLFSKNKFLHKINLEGNKFMSLRTKLLFKNSYLKVLNLGNSQINLLHNELFAGLPNLVELDLSRNLLNNFNLEDFKHLPNLKKLNLSKNFIKCDQNIKEKLKKLKLKGVDVTLDTCSSENMPAFNQRSTQMFEKIMMASGIMEQEQEIEEYRLNGIKQWRLNFNSEEVDVSSEEDELEFSSKESSFEALPDKAICNANNYVLCQEYRFCLQTINKAWPEKRLQTEQCSWNDVKFAFVLGLALGTSLVIIILAGILFFKRCIPYRREVTVDNLEVIQSQPLARPTIQLPANVRRQPRRRAADAAHPIVRYEGPVAENFLSRLFGRPARHQYYRSINQNTATLIRRLSRSNLFNNRLSQHFMERQTSSENSHSPYREEESFAPSAPRAETPPPSYGDIVINNCGQEK